MRNSGSIAFYHFNTCIKKLIAVITQQSVTLSHQQMSIPRAPTFHDYVSYVVPTLVQCFVDLIPKTHTSPSPYNMEVSLSPSILAGPVCEDSIPDSFFASQKCPTIEDMGIESCFRVSLLI